MSLILWLICRLHFGFAIKYLAIADHLDNTAELQVYLTHLKRGGCEYGIKHLPYFMYLELCYQMKKESILLTKITKGHLQDLEVVFDLVYKDFAACLHARAAPEL
jgi:hypothetical protein